MEDKYWSEYPPNGLSTILRNAAIDTIQNWIDSDLDFTWGLRYNNWMVDSIILIDKSNNRAIGVLVKRCFNQAEYDDIEYLNCEKRNGKWFFFEGATMVIPRSNYQKSLTEPLSFSMLSQIGRKQLLKGYYGYFVLFPYFLWSKEERFADPFWGSENDKIREISWVDRKKQQIEGLVLSSKTPDPNPFSKQTTISMFVPESVTSCFLEVFNSIGTQVKNYRINERGNVNLIVDASDYVAGDYIYSFLAFSVRTGQASQGYGRMTVVK